MQVMEKNWEYNPDNMEMKVFVDKNGKRFTREMMWETVETNGGIVAKEAKKGVDYLVQADKNSVSSKTQKALKVGTTIISEEEFWGKLPV